MATAPKPDDRPDRDAFVVWTQRTVGLASAAFLALYLTVVSFRIRFPFSLDWMESTILSHVRRVSAGLPIYARPSLDFIPTIYPPLYYWLAAAACRFFGSNLLPLRLVSALASVGVFAVIFSMVRRETGQRRWGLFAAGLFAATYSACGAWLDIGRVDSLYLFLLLLAASAIRIAETPAAGAAAGLCAAAAFFTKQTALPTLAPLLLWAAVFQRRRALPLLASFGATVAVGTFLLDRLSDGWFWRGCFAFPSQHPFESVKLPAFFATIFVHRMPLATAAAIGLFVVQLRRRPSAARTWFYPAALAGAVAGSLPSYLKVGGVDNNFLSTAAFLAVNGALAAAAAAQSGATLAARRRRSAALLLGCAAQFALLLYNPLALLPDAATARHGEWWVRSARSFAGDVYIPCNSALAAAAGKRVFADQPAWVDFSLTKEAAMRRAIESEMAASFAAGRFDAVFLAGFDELPLAPLLEAQYQLVLREPARNQRFGFYPRCMYIRKDLLPKP